MVKIFYEVTDEVCVKHTPVQVHIDGSITYKNELVIDKETFIKCYEKWIKGNEDNNKGEDNEH